MNRGEGWEPCPVGGYTTHQGIAEGAMIDLSTFLSQHPQLSPDVIHRIELFRASMELEVRQTVGRVQERKRSPYTGEDMGARLSIQAVREIEDTVIAFCSKLYEIVANEYVSAPGITGDLTATFEEMAGAALVEARRLFRNATAGVWFEGVPSLMELRLHKERADETPDHEIADYVDPEPNSMRVVSVVCQRVERLRDDATAAAMRLRVEHLKGLRNQDQPVKATPPEAETTGDSPQTSVPDGKTADRRTAADWDAERQAEASAPEPAEPTRMRGTVTSPSAARKMEAYLQAKGIGLTDFATSAGTTDRTLRSFRKTGKVRRDIFDSIAKQMGTTKEELLKD
jgi:hypothetical protein